METHIESSGLLELPGGAADAALPAPAPLRKGDIHSCMFRVQGAAPARGASLGVLVLRWRRQGCLSPPPSYTSLGPENYKASDAHVTRRHPTLSDLFLLYV